MSIRPRILVVDDEEAILETMTFTFEDDYEVLTSSSARDGLARIGDGRGGETDERGFLDPLLAVAESGRSPGEEVLASWEGAWRGSPKRLIEYSRY